MGADVGAGAVQTSLDSVWATERALGSESASETGMGIGWTSGTGPDRREEEEEPERTDLDRTGLDVEMDDSKALGPVPVSRFAFGAQLGASVGGGVEGFDELSCLRGDLLGIGGEEREVADDCERWRC